MNSLDITKPVRFRNKYLGEVKYISTDTFINGQKIHAFATRMHSGDEWRIITSKEDGSNSEDNNYNIINHPEKRNFKIYAVWYGNIVNIYYTKPKKEWFEHKHLVTAIKEIDLEIEEGEGLSEGYFVEPSTPS